MCLIKLALFVRPPGLYHPLVPLSWTLKHQTFSSGGWMALTPYCLHCVHLDSCHCRESLAVFFHFMTLLFVSLLFDCSGIYLFFLYFFFVELKSWRDRRAQWRKCWWRQRPTRACPRFSFSLCRRLHCLPRTWLVVTPIVVGDFFTPFLHPLPSTPSFSLTFHVLHLQAAIVIFSLSTHSQLAERQRNALYKCFIMMIIFIINQP